MNADDKTFDVIVIGGGHAGCEAALAAGRMGARVLMLGNYIDNIALMPCNPAIGGPAKGNIVCEIDALGGEQASATDAATLHLRWLNTSKGPAVRALRAQCDLRDYSDAYMRAIYSCHNILLYQAMVDEIVCDGGRVRGVVTTIGERFEARAVVMACGTYLRGTVHIGRASMPSGPLGQVPSRRLSDSLERIGLELGRFRTDTTPRIASDSVDWGQLTLQHSDREPQAFSHWSEKRVHDGYFCALTRTNARTHEIIRAALGRSPLATGDLSSKGPRYCPSIDDKVMRFPDRETHPIFLEPVGRSGREVYMQNFSTSMPTDVQLDMVRSLAGCERARIVRPGYGIEYDYVVPTQLEPWLEARAARGLFCAGQVCGTSGYEEAAAQGLIAGINAALSSRGDEPLVLSRDQAYIGVLIDDITTRGVDEPYRMLPSRCEFRLSMRHDNADDRLCDIGRGLGLIDDAKWGEVVRRRDAMRAESLRLESTRIPADDRVNDLLRAAGSSPLSEPVPALVVLSRPEICWDTFAVIVGSSLERELGQKIETEVKYAGYVERERSRARHLASMDALAIPDALDTSAISGLSAEASEKFARVRPRTLGAASRIPGVNSSDVQLIHVAIERMRGER